MHAITAMAARRVNLDTLVSQMLEPGFLARYECVPRAPAGNGHVDPGILAMEPTQSRYVRRWRKHARHCPGCRAVFRALGLRRD